jgi:hypothetical protein
MTTPQPRRRPPDSRLRLRLWIDGALIDEAWIDSLDPRAQDLTATVSEVHSHLAELADAHGVPWLTEVYDPEAPEDQAYIRVGTDKDGMVQPVVGTITRLLADIDTRIDGCG